jgi:hypothetical protein
MQHGAEVDLICSDEGCTKSQTKSQWIWSVQVAGVYAGVNCLVISHRWIHLHAQGHTLGMSTSSHCNWTIRYTPFTQGRFQSQ